MELITSFMFFEIGGTLFCSLVFIWFILFVHFYDSNHDITNNATGGRITS